MRWFMLVVGFIVAAGLVVLAAVRDSTVLAVMSWFTAMAWAAFALRLVVRGEL